MSDLDRFRAETREWLATNCPPGARGPGPIPFGSSKITLDADTRLWLDRMADRGWTVPTWPRAYGGAELSNAEYRILIEELTRIGARTPLTGRGVNYIGPTILELGTEAQKQRWLPGIARGQGAWAMGYSEPGAGSDLASLTARAERVGDELRINGRKTWTSDAVYCDYIFVLARTSQSPKKQDGISLILVDMHQPGVQVHPIRLLSGASPFNETVFDNAIASVDDVIGGLGNGWTVGKRLLQFERSTHAGINISGAQGGRTESSRMPEKVRALTADTHGRITDVAIRRSLIDYQLNAHAQRLTQARVIEETRARAPGFASSAVKLSNALLTQRGDELLQDAMGIRGLSIEAGPGADPEDIEQTKGWLYRKSLTIAGGTKEVQLNIIAKRVLGLPD